MTIALSLTDFWNQCTNQTTISPTETITWFPQQLGEGYFYGISLRPQLQLTVRQFQVRDRIFDSVPEAIALLFIIIPVNTRSSLVLTIQAVYKMNMAMS